MDYDELAYSSSEPFNADRNLENLKDMIRRLEHLAGNPGDLDDAVEEIAFLDEVIERNLHEYFSAGEIGLIAHSKCSVNVDDLALICRFSDQSRIFGLVQASYPDFFQSDYYERSNANDFVLACFATLHNMDIDEARSSFESAVVSLEHMTHANWIELSNAFNSDSANRPPLDKLQDALRDLNLPPLQK